MMLLRHILPILFALVLVLLLIYTSELSLAIIKDVLAAFTWVHGTLFVLLSIALLFLSAVKWRMVMVGLQRPGDEVPSLSAAFFYTCSGGALSLVFMPHVAMPMGRAFGARLHNGQPIVASVGTSLLEQLFDVAVIALFSALGLAVLFPQAIPGLIVAGLAGAAAIIFCIARPRFLPRRLRENSVLTLVRTPMPIRLLAISIVRYVFVAIRAAIIAAPAGISLPMPEFFASFSLVQISRIIAITPMGLGITDWTWAGVLSLHDISPAVAASFMLLSRSLTVFSTLSALIFSAILAAILRNKPT